MRKYNICAIRFIIILFCSVFIISILCLWVKYYFFSQDNGISASTAIEIAKEEIKKKETWNCEIRCEAFRTQTGWSVTVYRLPQVFGGERTIEISDKGEVTEYFPGI